MQDAAPLIHFPTPLQSNDWIERYLQEELAVRNPKTIDAYQRILTDFATWLTHKPGSRGAFTPQAMTKTALKSFFDEKKAEVKPLTHEEQGFYEAGQLSLHGRSLRYAPATLARMKVALGGLCDWLIDQGVLANNPTKGITLPKMAARPPRVLAPNQRYAIKQVVQRATEPRIKDGQIVPGSADLRGAAIFALGYYAGLRVSDVSHLLMRNTHVGPKVGWVLAGYKQESFARLTS